MKKKSLIAIYDVLALTIIALTVGIYSKNELIEYHDFDFTVNDTIEYAGYNLRKGLEIVSIGGTNSNFNYVDKFGKEISRNDCIENLTKYYSKGAAYRDSLLVDPSPSIAIKKLRAKVGFRYFNSPKSSYLNTMTGVLIINSILLILGILLIRQVLRLTLKGEIFSAAGTRVFKFIFFLSIGWAVVKYAGQLILLKVLFSCENIPVMYGSNGRAMSSSFKINFDFIEFYKYLIIIIVTFCLYMAFKLGQKIKSENELTI